MIEDDPVSSGTLADANAEASTTDAHDPHATRNPDAFDPHETRPETDPTTWPTSAGSFSATGSTSSPFPRFRIIRAHARGALGEVFVAHDSELRREVALKEIQDRHADDPCSRARFLLEAEVTGSLEHPGIVPVYGLGHHPDGRPYYAMRLIRGDSLKEAIDRYYRPSSQRIDPSERALQFRALLGRFVDICNAIAYAHSRDILHRDLKPGNVMLGPYGETLVVDWGLAKSLARAEVKTRHDGPFRPTPGESSETVMGSVVGTPAFMSPEQANGEIDRLGPASDVYSLGATLYCVLTGQTAFNDPSVVEVLAKVRQGDFPPPRQVRRDVPRALQAICLKAMATLPENRYPTARALAVDVEHWLAGASVSAYPDGIAVQLWRWCRRRPVRTTAALACVFFDLCALVVLLLAYARSVLHTGSMLSWNIAAGVLVLTPFAGQLGALIGMALGAAIGRACRQSLRGLRQGASVGLKFGVPVAIVVWLGSGIFGVIEAPKLTALFKPTAAPEPLMASDWPRLPGAVVEKPAWIKAGAPVDIAAFFDDPPPQENAAPLYLDAFLEFGDEMGMCFSSDEGGRRGKIARDRMNRFHQYDQAMRDAPDSVDRSELDALLEEYGVGFLKLKQAQRRPQCVFRTGLGIETLLPHIQAAREVARVAALRTRRQLERGEIDRAIEDVPTLIRLARDFQPRGHLITQLVGISIEFVAYQNILLPILRQPGLEIEQCDQLLTVLGDHSSACIDPFAEGFRSEYVGVGHTIHTYVDRLVREEKLGGSRARNILRSLLTTDPNMPVDADPELRAGFARMEERVDVQISKSTPKEFAESSHRAYDEFHREILDLARLPMIERIEAAHNLPPKLLKEHPLLLFLSPDGGAFLKAVGRSEATRNAMKCLVSLRRWELTGKGESVDLEAVVHAAGLAKVPTDPFRADGGPLRLVIRQGEPIVFSIGLDGVDDGGLIDAKLGDEPKGDYLYLVKPATSTR